MDMLLKIGFYILRKAIVIAAVAFLLGTAALIAYDSASIFIVANEGLEKRASVILSGQQNLEDGFLNRFFTDRFLMSDILLNNNIYERFNIYDYSFRLTVKRLWVWPWDSHVKIIVDEVISRMIGEPRDIAVGPEALPEWENGTKEITLIREIGRWQIDDILFIEPILETPQ